MFRISYIQEQMFVQSCSVNPRSLLDFRALIILSCVHVHLQGHSPDYFALMFRVLCFDIKTFVCSRHDFLAVSRLSFLLGQSFVCSCPKNCEFSRLSSVHVQLMFLYVHNFVGSSDVYGLMSDHHAFRFRRSCAHVMAILRSLSDFLVFSRLLYVHFQPIVPWSSDFRAFIRLLCMHFQASGHSPDYLTFSRLSCFLDKNFMRSCSKFCTFKIRCLRNHVRSIRVHCWTSVHSSYFPACISTFKGIRQTFLH